MWVSSRPVGRLGTLRNEVKNWKEAVTRVQDWESIWGGLSFNKRKQNEGNKRKEKKGGKKKREEKQKQERKKDQEALH